MNIYFRNFSIFISTAFFFLAHAVAGTTLFFETEDSNDKTCLYQGEIIRSDVEIFKKKIIESKCTLLRLNSRGGDVLAAIDMGRLVRRYELPVMVEKKATCASACVLIYAGGVIRSPYAPIQIHRPYLQASNLTLDETQQQFIKIEKQINLYLREVNVNTSLFQRMMEIAPENSRSLTMDEMEILGIGGRDPVYTEYLDNAKAKTAGMTKAEWLSSKRYSTNLCGDIEGIIGVGKSDSIYSCWKSNFPRYFVKLNNQRN